jgi:hypothetical protein
MAGIACLGIYKTDLDGNGRSQLVEDAARCNGRFVFLFQTALALAPYIRARCPDVCIIGRPTWFPDDAAQIAQGPEAAKAWARQMLAEHPECDVYQYVCEQIPGARPDSDGEKQEQYRRLAAQVDAEIAAADVFHAAGKGLVAINVAPGIIPMEEHPDQLRVWREHLGRLFAHPGVHYYGIHSYGTPDDVSPGCKGRMQTDWASARWYALRFQSHLAGLARLGLQPPAIIHTECGQTDGWRGFISEDEAKADFRWFLDVNQREPRVAGCVVFLHGDHDPAKWHPFDTQGSGLLDVFADWNAAHPCADIPAPTPQPEPQPETGGGQTMLVGNLEVVDLRTILPQHATERYGGRSIGGIEQIVIHHSATPDDRSAEAIARYHVDNLGWPGIAYHFLVHQDGRTEYCQPIEIVSYGVAKRNDNTLHICLVGNFTDAPPGEPQIQAARKLVENLCYALGRIYPVVGHTDIAVEGYATACPGTTWPQWKHRLIATTPTGTVDWEARCQEAEDRYSALVADVKALAARL